MTTSTVTRGASRPGRLPAWRSSCPNRAALSLVLVSLCLSLGSTGRAEGRDAPILPQGVRQTDPVELQVVGHLGGDLRAVITRPPFVFASFGERLRILELTADSEWREHAEIRVPASRINALAMIGNQLVIAGSQEAGGLLRRYDIDDPDRPILIASPDADVEVLALDGSGPEFLVLLSDGRLQVLDWSEPGTARLLGQMTVPRPGGHLAWIGSYGLLSYSSGSGGGSRVRIADLSEPAAPRYLDDLHFDTRVSALLASDDRLFVGTERQIEAYRLSAQAAVARMWSMAPEDWAEWAGGHISSLALQGDRLFAGSGRYMGDDVVAESYLSVLDLSQMVEPQPLRWWRTGRSGPSQLQVSGEQLIAGFGGSLQVVDQGQSGAYLSSLGNYGGLGHVAWVDAAAGRSYVASSASLWRLNSDNPRNPVLGRGWSDRGDSVRIKAQNDALLAQVSGFAAWGLHVLDPDSLARRHYLRIFMQDAVLREDLLYSLESSDAGLQIYDLAAAGEPQTIGGFPLPREERYALLSLRGDRALVAGSRAIRMLDIGEPDAPREILSRSYQAAGQPRGLVLDEAHAYLALNNRILVLGFADLDALPVLSILEGLSDIHAISLVPDPEATLLLVAAGHELLAYDLSSPTQARLSARLPLAEPATSIAWQDGLAYVAAGDTGLYVVELQREGIDQAPSLFVDGRIGSASCPDYSVAARACGDGSEQAYRELAGAAQAAGPGDSVSIRGGSYAEALIPARSGEPDRPITFRSHSGETARIEGAALDPAIDISGRQHIVIEGLEIVGVRRWLWALDTHHCTLRGNTFRNAQHTGGSAKTGIFFQEASHNRILDNHIEDSTQDNLALIKSDRNLVRGNTILEAAHVLWVIKCGSQNVIRGNRFHNAEQKIGEIYDCWDVGFDKEFRALDATRRNLVEDNDFAYTPSSGDRSPYAGIQYAGQEGIIRRNRFYDMVGPGLSMTLYPDEAKHNHGNRVYHTVFWATDFAGIEISGSQDYDFGDNVFKNNVLADSVFVANDRRWDWYSQELEGQPVQLKTGRLDGIHFDHNAIHSRQAPGDGPYLISYGSRFESDNPPPRPVDWWERQHAAAFKSFLVADPAFEQGPLEPQDGEPWLRFQPRPDSPLIDAGTFLTKATADGPGTMLPVADPRYFHDGFGIAGEQGDAIQLEGQRETARVVAVDLEGSTLTLDRPLSWREGQGISLAYSGPRPDIGARELPQSPPRPTASPMPAVPTTSPEPSSTVGLRPRPPQVWLPLLLRP